MEYYKTVGGMFAAAFAERGMTDDKGNPIQPTEEPMTEAEYQEHRTKTLIGKTEQLNWICSFCRYDNKVSDGTCRNCGHY